MNRITAVRGHCLKTVCCSGLLLLLTGLFASPALAGDDGFRPIFDGKTLKDWDGNPKFWRVEDGTLTGQTTKDNPTKSNTFLIWRGGEVGDFELTLQYRIVGGNSGIQYRSFEIPNQKWVVGGYQADIDSGDRYSGILYGERFRGILADRGQKTALQRTGDKFQVNVVQQFGDFKALQDKIHKEDWNDYHVIAKGFHFVHMINGHVMSECTDNDVKMRREKGIVALQLHAGEPMKVQFRNIRLKTLGSQDNGAARSGPGDVKKIVFVAGTKSHGFAAHEHKAGCLLLAKALNDSGLPVRAEVHTGGWPAEPQVFDGADAIVVYADGGGRHPVLPHLDEVDRLMKQGVGLVCLHYGVEVPKGEPGHKFLDWIGGYFETDWSVNPHWTAQFDKLPVHPVTRGVQPFSIRDEWYYHMRFRTPLPSRSASDGLTPILTDLPPKETLNRPDGTHSNNPAVRQAVLERKEPQHVAWAYERPDGGRGFGFSGGHVHWNWGNPDFRKLVLNAIVWAAKAEVPEEGVPSRPLSVDDLLANQDFDPPENFNPADIESMLQQWNRPAAAK